MYAGDLVLVLFLPGLIFLLHPRIPPFSIVISAPRQQRRIPGCTISNLSSTNPEGHSFSQVMLFRAVLHYYVQQRDGGSSTETHCERRHLEIRHVWLPNIVNRSVSHHRVTFKEGNTVNKQPSDSNGHDVGKSLC